MRRGEGIRGKKKLLVQTHRLARTQSSQPGFRGGDGIMGRLLWGSITGLGLKEQKGEDTTSLTENEGRCYPTWGSLKKP